MRLCGLHGPRDVQFKVLDCEGGDSLLMSENRPSESDRPAPSDQKAHESEHEIAERESAKERAEEAIHDSEVRYRKLFESTGDAIMLLGEKGFLECNEATLQLFGCRTREEFISKHPSELSPPYQPDGTDSLTAANERIARAHRDGTARFEWMHRRHDGSDFMADVLLARVELQSGSILQAVVRDITQRKLVEQALRDAQEKLEQRVQERTAALAAANEELQREVVERRRAEKDLALERFLLATLMEYAPDFIFFKDQQSRFIRISRALAHFYGLDDPADAIGKSDSDFYDAQRSRKYMEDEQEIMRTGRSVLDSEQDQTSPDGRITWQLTNKVPLYNPEGEIIGTFGISRDITHRKEAEARLQAAMREAEAANRAKSEFLANMSHEIRTPMNAITGMTELVLDTPLTESQRDYLNMVRDSGEVLLTVINDILDFSKVEAGKLELERKAFEIREVFGDAMKSLGLRAHSKGLELVCQIRPSVPEWLIGDASRLRQVAVNLVGNAIKFTESGEVLLTVDCMEVKGGRAVLRCAVVDTGVGIAADKQTSIFNAFEQADNSTTRRYGGTGLGLAISSRLVHAMGGEIWVDSRIGHGSTFHFTVELDVSEKAPQRTRFRTRAVAGGIRVLVVDDNATNRMILEEMCRNWHMQSQSVSSANDALQRLHAAHESRKPFDLVLTDANMPDCDGFMLAAQIKNDKSLGSTLIMMLTSGGRPGDIARCDELGIASYLLKPVKQSELFDAIALSLGITSAEDMAEMADAADRPVLLQSLRILLAEDSLVNQRLAVGLLEKFGHQVDVVPDGLAAVAAVESKAYDLVLMDVQMPELDGLEATKTIRTREQEGDQHIPIVAMTAHAMKGDRERCLAAGMDDYVAKPIRAKDLFQAIKNVLPEAASGEAD